MPSRFLLLTALLFCISILPAAELRAQNDIYQFDLPDTLLQKADQDKTVRELIREATMQMESEPLSARSKLQLALKKDPESALALTMLGSYYTRHVGHYRLALKYYKQAETVLEKLAGAPPYFDFETKTLHADIIRQLSIVRQNLDDYQGAIAELDRYENKYGYSDPYLASSRSWIYFKQKNYAEAIEVAKDGIRRGENTLNILGILYSVTGERERAVRTLKAAYDYEKSLGAVGQASTPLNNLGEVYRETFAEQNAVDVWLQSLRLPDGCEHILPSLNLAVIYLEALSPGEASVTLDKFEQCFAQFPLRNDEEHRALLELMRGRIALYRGNFEQALTNFQAAEQRQQWFGKIGTDVEDLQAGLYQNMGAAYLALSAQKLRTAGGGLATKAGNYLRQTPLRIKSWWYLRKARLVLVSDLDDFSDAFLRSTDSLLDYPGLGIIFAGFPRQLAAKYARQLSQSDSRESARLYYQTYLAEALLSSWFSRLLNHEQAFGILEQTIADNRSEYDDALKARAMALLIKYKSNMSFKQRQTLQTKLLQLQPSLFTALDLPFVANTNKDFPATIAENLKAARVQTDNSQKTNFLLVYRSDATKHTLYLYDADKKTLYHTITASSSDEPGSARSASSTGEQSGPLSAAEQSIDLVNEFVTTLFKSH